MDRPQAADNAVERPRLFFALWPDAPLQHTLAKIAAKSLKKKGRLVRNENLHITLFYLGPTEAERRACAERVAEAVRAAPFTLRLERLEHWPKPRILCSLPSEHPPALHTLVNTLRSGLAACRFEPEVRAYRAHVTLARKVAHAGSESTHRPLEWPVDHFCLVESKTLPSGARYQVVKSWPLHAAD